MNRKLVFLDIDGTFVSEMAAPSVRSADAVRRARGNGHRVFLATTMGCIVGSRLRRGSTRIPRWRSW